MAVTTRSKSNPKKSETMAAATTSETMAASKSGPKKSKTMAAATRSVSTSKKQRVGTKRTKKRASKKQTADDLIKYEAESLFMVKDFYMRYFKLHPLTTNFIPQEAMVAGELEWDALSDRAKSMWIDEVKQLEPQGTNLYEVSTQYGLQYRHQ